MATYRTLVDVYLNNAHILAGTTLTLADNFVPSAAFDPLDTPAVTAFYAAGPQPPPLVRTQWSTQFVAPPTTFWKSTTIQPGLPYQTWSLTGLGSNLPPKTEWTP